MSVAPEAHSVVRGARGVVAIGGGHGLARALAALRGLGLRPTAIVTAADDGGSSGRLRRDLDIIAPGDLRRALLSLARDRALAEVLAHRFDAGELAGHALGNLLLVALAEREGDIVSALDRAAGLLDCAGRVLPSTTTPVDLVARIDGAEVHGQRRITTAGADVEALALDPADPPACAEAVAAIDAAEAIVLGPGSLHTSVVANLLVPGIREAVGRSQATLVAVANLRTQAGEDPGLDADGHLAVVLDALAGRQVDHLVVNDGPVRCDAGTRPLRVDAAAAAGPQAEQRVGAIVRADLAERDERGEAGAAHDPGRLGAVLADLLAIPRGP
ncbi:MAG: YvcK family protein [Egibacteraceae bacterium]